MAALAEDYMVFSVTKVEAQVRISAIEETVSPSPASKDKIPPSGELIPRSEFILSGADPMLDVVGPIYDEINELYDIELKPSAKKTGLGGRLVR